VRNVGHSGRVTLPAAYVTSWVELLYATTAQRAQGDTVDTAHRLIAAGMSRDARYILAPRARERTTLYVATHDRPFGDDPRVHRARIDRSFAIISREADSILDAGKDGGWPVDMRVGPVLERCHRWP
jgi:hypothetical protein